LQLPGSEVVDVVGPICESADFFAKDRALPPVKRGDLIAIFTAGAYGFSMSSNYNARPRAAEVLVEDDKFSVIRKRESYQDLVKLES
jgi:diaminopimelate decarboxylase